MSKFSSTLTRPQSTESLVGDFQPESKVSTAENGNPRVIQMMKSLYQTDQQAKFLNLQAEVDSLLEQLKSLKQQRLASAEEGTLTPDIATGNGS